jgi:beta-glucosidase
MNLLRFDESMSTIASKTVSSPRRSAIILVTILNLCLWLPAAFAADEICASCGTQVSVSGDFAHRKSNPSVVIEGASADAAPFREDINGKNFTVTISHLPAGKYTIAIGEAEITASAAGDRVFDVTAGDVSLAKDFDIFATAGAARKVCYIKGAIEHEDDALKGPVKITFAASNGNAKFNTFEVKDSSGAPVLAFSASELADAFSAAAMRVPEISEPPIWRDPSHPLKDRANDLIRRMSLAQKLRSCKMTLRALRTSGCPPIITGTKHCTASPTTASPRFSLNRSAAPLRGTRSCFTRKARLSAWKAALSSTITPLNTTAIPSGGMA